MNFSERDSAEYLHTLGRLYWRAGNLDRGLVFLLLAARVAPDDVAILKTLATVFIEQGAANRALTTIDRIAGLGDEFLPELAALESRALWTAGQFQEARDTFSDFMAKRSEPSPTAPVGS
ncbi:type III secretion protein (plasmid) [Phyllobacterium sp. 628]|uniref:tetratricopeptide repeat protein n=1 Tax=Phyllobacterium sp. 628 TaxID=2718938 RepID=UPI0016621E84|nr:type III secretion protein [Phyllobacterium sp. 628]QND54409.1 type III secretion protein [Phyllobacterium sp. 628]